MAQSNNSTQLLWGGLLVPGQFGATKARPLSRNPAAFWGHARKTEGGCMEWRARNGQGYGVLRDGSRLIYAHRHAWVLANGSIPIGLSVCHKCDNPPCINPEHLFLGTARDNAADMTAKGRRPRGEAQPFHKLTPRDVREIRERVVAGDTMRGLGRRYGISHTQVQRIVAHERWAHIE